VIVGCAYVSRIEKEKEMEPMSEHRLEPLYDAIKASRILGEHSYVSHNVAMRVINMLMDLNSIEFEGMKHVWELLREEGAELDKEWADVGGEL
jgi:hypothetical protein